MRRGVRYSFLHRKIWECQLMPEDTIQREVAGTGNPSVSFPQCLGHTLLSPRTCSSCCTTSALTGRASSTATSSPFGPSFRRGCRRDPPAPLDLCCPTARTAAASASSSGCVGPRGVPSSASARYRSLSACLAHCCSSSTWARHRQRGRCI